MDDDEDDREFSKGIVYGFFEQADTTFQKMDTALYASIPLSPFPLLHPTSLPTLRASS